jgi:hypothetical protein
MSVRPSQSTWHAIQEDLNLQNGVIPAVIYISLGTSVIKMIDPSNSFAGSQTQGS